MTRYRIIGSMTGNSMDAIDLVLTEFNADKITDICSYSEAYTGDMRKKVNQLRNIIVNYKVSMKDLEERKEFQSFHNEYIWGIANAIKKMCRQNDIDLSSVDAIGFHGKTLDYSPPSINQKYPYTLQIGSGQMLANLTGLPVIYDFRSNLIMNNYEAAPLIGPHNAHIAAYEGDGIYYNAGNTSNLAVIINQKTKAAWDAGPFNAFSDALIRRHTKNKKAYDINGEDGLKGKLIPLLLKKLFDKSAFTETGHNFYNLPFPKSGDPAFYHLFQIKDFQEPTVHFYDVLHTCEYFSAYIAVHSLKYIPVEWEITPRFILFGGGWHNQVAMQTFKNLLKGKGFILSEHKKEFELIQKRFGNAEIFYSAFGEFMEARLCADLARYFLEKKTWELPELIKKGEKLILGVMRKPFQGPINDKMSLASKGWQNNKN